MKIRALICVWLVGLLGLAMCGAGLPDIGLSSGQGRYAAGLRTGLHNNGGGIAGWDTATVLFSPEARVVTAIDLVNYPQNPAGVDTFALPASPSAADIARIVKLNSRLLGRDGTIYSFRDGPSDSARVLRLGTGFDVPTFAYGQVDTASPDGYKDVVGITVSIISDARWTQDPDGGGPRGTSSYLETRFATANRRAELVYIPFASHLPAGCTIVSANMNVAHAPGWYIDYPDSVIATLMSNASDDQWYKFKGWGSFTDMAHVAWQRQRSINEAATPDWDTVDASPWSPALSARKYLWQWGTISDWTGVTDTDLATPTPTQTGFDIGVSNCVQAAVNGTTNNGILLTWAEMTASASTGTHYMWDDASTAIGRTPYVAVKYITKRYQPQFGTSDFAFVFATDDGVFPANTVFSDTIAGLGGKYTLYMAQTQVIIGNAGASDYSTSQQITDFRTVRGNEVGSHSRYHKLLGLAHYERKDATFSGADWDSLLDDSSPDWMYTMADSVYGDLRGDPCFGKSLAQPNNQSSPTVMNAMNYHNYVTMRSGAAQFYDRTKYYDKANFAPARTDSLSSGAVNQAARFKRNMIGLPYTVACENITGIKGNTHTTAAELDSVKNNTRKLLFQLRGDGRRTLMLFTHDLKTDASYAYTDGLDGNEIGSIGRVVNELGGRWMTASEYGRWIQATATAVDSPTRVAVPDSFSYDAADRVWFKPHGVDNRWIRGVR